MFYADNALHVNPAGFSGHGRFVIRWDGLLLAIDSNMMGWVEAMANLQQGRSEMNLHRVRMQKFHSEKSVQTDGTKPSELSHHIVS